MHLNLILLTVRTFRLETTQVALILFLLDSAAIAQSGDLESV